MFRSGNWRQEFRALLTLAGPLIVNNLAIAGIHFADAVMAGRIGAETLAAVAIGGSIWFFGFHDLSRHPDGDITDRGPSLRSRQP